MYMYMCMCVYTQKTNEKQMNKINKVCIYLDESPYIYMYLFTYTSNNTDDSIDEYVYT